MNFTYLVVEGPHDAELLGKILRLSDFKQVTQAKEVDAYWRLLIPSNFPYKGNLLTRMPVPYFYGNQDHSVAIQVSMGDGSIPNALQESLEVISLAGLSAVGILLDADSAIQPLERFNKLKTAVTAHVSNWPNEPGAIDQGPPRTGIFVLPDNTSPGTLEDLLIESAEVTWPPLLALSQEFVKAGIQLTDALDKAERDQLRKPAGPNKATVGCIATLFRPGKSVQVSIHDNDWVSAKSIGLPRMNALKNFIDQLIGVEATASTTT